MLVKVDGRIFVVKLSADGVPSSINERKVWMPGTPYARVYNSPYWHHSHKLGKPSTLPARILAAAGGASHA